MTEQTMKKKSDLTARAMEEITYQKSKERGGPMEISLQKPAAQTVKGMFEELSRSKQLPREAIIGGATAILMDRMPDQMREMMDWPKKRIEESLYDTFGLKANVEVKNPKRLSISLLDESAGTRSIRFDGLVNPMNPREYSITFTLSKKFSLPI